MLNEVGVPPAKRSIQRRRRETEAEQAEAEQAEAAPSANPLIVSIIAFGAVLAMGLAVAWLVL